MNDDMPNQSAVTGSEPSLDEPLTEVEKPMRQEADRRIDFDLEDDQSYRGPESWREVADTLADPVEPE